MTAQTVEGLLVQIEANTELLRRELDKGDKRLEKSDRQVKKTTDNMKNSFEGVGKVLAGIYVANRALISIKKTVKGIADLGRNAERLGLGVEQFQELTFAANQNGVTVKNASNAMLMFTRRVDDARNGKGELLATVKRYNIELNNANGTAKNANALLRTFADVTQKAETQSEKNNIAQKMFSYEGRKLVSVLKDGSEGLDKYGQKARDLGLIMSQESVASAIVMERKLKQVSTVIKNQFNTALLDSITTLDALIERGGQASSIGDMLAKSFSAAGKSISKSMIAFKAANEAQAKTLVDSFKNLFSGKKSDSGFWDNFVKTRDAIEKQVEATKELNNENALKTAADEEAIVVNKRRADAISRVVESLEFEFEQLSRNKEEQAVYNALQSAGIDISDKEATQITELVKKVEARKKQIEIEKQAIKTEEARQESIKKTIEDLKHELNIIMLSNREKEIANSIMTSGVNIGEKEAKIIEELAGKLYDKQIRMERVKQAGDEVGRAITSSFENAIWKTESLTDSIKNLDKALAQIILRSAVFAPLEGAIGAGISSFFGGSGSTQSYGQLSTGESVILPQSKPAVPKFATGGNHSGGYRIVGESGRELEATGSSKIFSAAQTKDILSGGSGGGYSPTINVDARNSTLSAEQIKGIVEVAVAQSVNEVSNRQKRSGSNRI
jgi:hypothetical protein